MNQLTPEELALKAEFKHNLDRFGDALLAKLMTNERKYNFGTSWKKPDWEARLQHELPIHVTKGDPRDVAIYAFFAWYHKWRTAPISTLDEAVTFLLPRFAGMDEQLQKGEDYFASFCHSQLSGGIGMQIRNELKLWVHESPLHQHFLTAHQLFEADAMSDLIIRHIYRKLKLDDQTATSSI